MILMNRLESAWYEGDSPVACDALKIMHGIVRP
jgi:hypothetical protein